MRNRFFFVFYVVAAMWLFVAAIGRVVIIISTGGHLDALPFISVFIALTMLIFLVLIPKDS